MSERGEPEAADSGSASAGRDSGPSDHGVAFYGLVLAGGLLFGFGLGVSNMARPEVVLSFLQLEDLGLLAVMGGAAGVTMLVVHLAPRLGDAAPLTGDPYGRRLKDLDRNVVLGGAIFGAGWGLSGVCPGAGYASLGIGNYAILWSIAGMFVGAYVQGYWRSSPADDVAGVAPSD